MKASRQKAIFIDKDGTLIPDIPYNVDPAHISLQEGAAEGLKWLQASGYLLIVITNQSGVARGYFKEEALKEVQQKIEQLLLGKHIVLNGFYYCPHYPEGTIKEFAVECDCRKPQPGLILKAALNLHIDLHQSWMIGDSAKDIEAGKKAGCKTILINHHEKEEKDDFITPDFTATNLWEAAQQILHFVPGTKK